MGLFLAFMRVLNSARAVPGLEVPCRNRQGIASRGDEQSWVLFCCQAPNALASASR